MAFRMSEQARTIKIYNLLAGTNEFIGEGDAYIPPHTGLPANSTDIAPPDIPAGFVAVFNSDEASWHLVEDHRGKTVYDVASGDELFISELGPLPENVTWLSPEGEFQKWNGTAWVKDTEAEKLFRIREAEETKNNLMQVASEHIAPGVIIGIMPQHVLSKNVLRLDAIFSLKRKTLLQYLEPWF